MKNLSNRSAGERGAVTIKTIMMLFVVALIIFVTVKIVPVYVEQRKVMFDVEELARISAVRNYKEERITPEIAKIRTTYDLPESAISFVKREGETVHIAVKYTRSVDFLVTTYDWKVDNTIIGKDL